MRIAELERERDEWKRYVQETETALAEVLPAMNIHSGDLRHNALRGAESMARDLAAQQARIAELEGLLRRWLRMRHLWDPDLIEETERLLDQT